ncbi:Retrovirus-related Pol polyprotein from transposon 17.6 [Vitis vinifera]|uniref:Retrovirus-related Pol polyprotein from transposon 17.6 n=1 Tax=Vitis vinifera TaxID=29760 RepID=A0A438I3U8_VITVI|nr:Retrovirus-related Pol polyprotein from transposon 17.6 [Vitis vinifera]
MDVSLESKSLPSVGYSRKSYLEVTSQRLARGKLVHFHGWKSLALPSVGPAKTTKLCILALGTFPGNLSSKELEKEKHYTVQKGCEITSQQKGDFATLCKMLPSARSDWLVMAATSSFQLRIAHRHRSSRRPPFQSQFLGTPYQMIQHGQYRPVAPIRPVGPTYLHPPPQPVYATQAPQRPPMQFHHQYRAPPPPGQTDLHCAYHQRAGHDTDSCSALRHAIQDLIDQGLVDLGRPGVATDPLPTHDTRAVPPPPEGVHLIEFAGDEIFMMGWDGEAPQPISLYEESDFVGYIPRQQIPRPFSLTPDRIYGPPPVSPVYLQHVPPMTPFILFPEEYRPPHRDVQIVTRSGRVAQPPPVDRPFAGIAAREEVQREDDEILRQLRTTQARISIWSLLASSSTHRDALVRALGQIRVDTATTPEGLIHMLTADRATCIVFSDDDLPPEGSNHVRPLFIDVACLGRRVPSVLLDNGSALNVCPLVTAIALGFSPDDFGPSTQTVRAYDGTQRTVMGTLSTHVMIGPVSYSIVFQVLRIQSSFNLLLGRPWIHEAGAIPSSLHQKVKFIHEGRIITIQSDRDIITSSEPVLHISHSEDDLHLTGFTFDEVQVVSLEDGSRDMVPMSFDQHSSTLVLNMMRGMSYLPGMGLGRRQQGPHEFTFTVDHDTPYGLGHPAGPGSDSFGHRTTEAPGAMIVTPPSPDRASMFSMCFPEEVPDYDLPMDLGYGTDEMDMIGIGRIFDAAPHGPHTVFDMFGVFVLETDEDDSIPDAYTDDMDFIGIGRILDAAPRGPLSAFDISGVSVLDDESVLDVVTSDFASVEGASDSVDPPLSFDTMSGFVTRFDDISDGNNDMSIFEYLNVSQHFPLIAPPAPTTHIYDVDDVGDTDDPLGGQSECDSDTEDRKVTPISSSTELIDFGAPDQPREIRIGSSLSPDERSRLIDLLRSYLDVFAWSYEDMPGLDPTIVQHHLPILPHARPVKQKLRRLHPRWSLQVKEEIQKQLSVGFLSVVEYPEWLANVVPVPKKDGKILMAPEDMVKTSFITEWGTYCYRVMPFGLKNAGATYQRAATTLFHDMMHRDVEVYVDDMIVKSRDRADHLAALQRFFERIRQFRLRLNPKKCTFGVTSGKLLGHIVSERGRLQYISRFIARLTDICEPIFCLLRKNQPTVWNDDCQRAFERIKECLLSPSFSASHTGVSFASVLISFRHALGYMLAQLDDLRKERAIYYLSKRMLEYECKYIMIERLCLAVGDHIPRSVRLAFSDHHRLTNNIVEYEACITDSSIWRTRDEKLKPYHAYLDLLIDRFDVLRYIHLPRTENQFAYALATLASLIVIPAGVNVKPLLIETRSAPTYCCLIGEIEDQIELPWYHDIYQFQSCGAYPELASAKDRRALRQLATRFVVCGDALYRRSPDGLLLLCLDRASADRVIREVHAGVCGPHMGSHMLALWGIDIIGKISPKSSSGHEYILVAIDYFTKWVEAASYARLTAARVAKFIRSHIICRYEVPHELISDRGVHFKGEVDTLIQEYGIQHHRPSAYRPQTNGAVEDANKNIKRILRKMVETSRDWSEKLPFALWAYRTSFRTSIGATPYSLVYGMEAVLPVEIKMRSLRVALEQHISEAEWAQSRYDQLSLLDEKRLRAADHV